MNRLIFFATFVVPFSMIDQTTIDRIIDAARIEEVVGEFVTLRKRGINYTGLCPFHEERTPSFSVSPTKGICKCFSCGKGGNVVHFIMEHEQLSYYEALKWLAKKYNIEVAERALSPAEEQARNDRESLFILNEFARDYYQNILYEHQDGKALGLGYFRERGFREDILRKFQLGFSLDQKDHFSMTALTKGYKRDFLLKSGLSLENEQGGLRDRYRARVMFPVHTLSGKIVAFGGRILKKDDKTAKYINSPESEIYHKSNELYGIYFAKQAIAKFDKCYLVEGYTDVLSMHQAGIENVVASSGTALTHGQIRLIHRFTTNVTVLYDGDAAGIRASLKGINLLLEDGLNIKVLLLPDGEDPDSFARKHSASGFADYLKANETDFIRFKTDILLKEAGDDPAARARLIQDIVESIALIADDITRTVYTTECSRQLNIREEVLQKEVDKRRIQHLRQQPIRERVTPTGQPGGNPASQGSLPPAGRWEESSVTGAPPPGFTPDPPTTTPDGYQPINEGASQGSTPVRRKLEMLESNLIRFIVRYGDHRLFKEETPGNPPGIAVIDFIHKELDEEQIEFTNPIFADIFAEAIELSTRAGFKPQRYFVNHPDATISMIAADMLSDPYELSKIHTKYAALPEEAEQLDELVPRGLLELRNGVLEEIILETESRLKTAAQEKNDNEVMDLSAQLMALLDIKKDLAKNLGERIIVRH